MNSNTFYNNLYNFAERTEKRISVSEFIDLLKTTSRSDTKAAQEQFNLQTTGGQWITLSYENIISMSYKGRIYRVT